MNILMKFFKDPRIVNLWKRPFPPLIMLFNTSPAHDRLTTKCFNKNQTFRINVLKFTDKYSSYKLKFLINNLNMLWIKIFLNHFFEFVFFRLTVLSKCQNKMPIHIIQSIICMSENVRECNFCKIKNQILQYVKAF